MICNIFNTVLIMSFTGSMAFLVFGGLSRMLKTKLSSRHICIAYFIILMIFLYPFSITYNVPVSKEKVPDFINTEERIITYEYISNRSSVNIGADTKKADDNLKKTNNSEPNTLLKYISLMWLLISVYLFAKKIIIYMIFSVKLLKNSEYLKKYRGVRVYSSSELTTPIAVGLFRQKIILPQTVCSDTEEEYILMHEYSHIRRGDIVGKWIAMLAVCVHWFNPFIYVISKIIDEMCEYACDEAVSGKMTECQKKEYMNTILSMISRSVSQSLPLSTKMSDEKRNIRKRFEIISSSHSSGFLKKTMSFSFLCIFTALIFTSCASVGGKFYGDRIPSLKINTGKNKDVLIAETVSDRTNNKDTRKMEESEIEYIISYPEYTDKTEFQYEEKNEYEKNSNSIEDEFVKHDDTEELQQEREMNTISRTDARLTLDEDSMYAGDLRGELHFDSWSFEKMISDLEASQYTLSSGNETNLEDSYVTGTLTYETGNVAKISNVRSDSKGHIEFYMDTGYEQYVEVGFEYDGKKIGGAGIVPGSEKLYYFGGFDPDKTYDITIKSSSGDTWQTTSKYVVY